MLLERILVPLDGSPTAEAILPQLHRLLRARGSEVVLHRSVSLLAAGLGVYPASGLDADRLLQDLEAEATAYLARVAAGILEEGARVRQIVRVGTPAESILAVAAKEKATLVAMSTHGRSGLSRWILGSVAEKVLRASTVPLLLVRSYTRSASGEDVPAALEELPIRRILVPIDLSELSLALAPEVTELAETFGARVEVLHVREAPGHDGGEGRHVLADAVRVFETRGEPVVPLLRHGEPAAAILETCRDRSIDLLAMTTHGRSGIARWTIGSVTDKVLRTSGLPMLVFREGDEEIETVAVGIGEVEGER